MRSAVARIRAGYTLLELMLVLVVLIVASAISIPVIDAMMADHRLKAARDMVRARWADIRGRAMKEGRPYKFSIIDNTGKFKIEPEDADAAPDGDGDERPLVFEGELPEKVLFCKDETSFASEGFAPAAGAEYETVVVYLPEGIARDDYTLMFGIPGARPIGLRLRALTGAVTAIDSQIQENRP